MPRPSKLSKTQWADVEQRLIAGESGTSLAKEFGISYNGIKKRLGSQTELSREQIKKVAKQIITTEEALAQLPVSSQVLAVNLAQRLRSISEHLSGAASFGAMTAHRLSMIANEQVEQIDSTANLAANEGSLKSILAMTRGANDAAQIGLNLLGANKDLALKITQGAGLGDDVPVDTSNLTKEELLLLITLQEKVEIK